MYNWCMKFIKIGFIVGAIIILFVLIFFINHGLRSFLHPAYYLNTNSTAVVKELKALNRYETASFTIEKVIEAGTQGNEFQNLLFGDKILLIAHGQVIAGFDLSSIRNQDVTVNGSSLILNLPKPQILVSKLDNDQTRVYDRKLGLLTNGDQNLESKARLAAEQSITKAACQEHI